MLRGLADSSLSADAFHDIVVPYISRDEKFSQISSGLVGAGTAAGSTALAYYALDPMFLSPQGVGAFEVMALGVASEMAGNYAWNTLIKPMVTATA